MLELPLAQPCQPAGLAQRQLVLLEEQHGDLLAQLRLGPARRLQDFIKNDQTHGVAPFCLVARVERFFELLRFSLGLLQPALPAPPTTPWPLSDPQCQTPQ